MRSKKLQVTGNLIRQMFSTGITPYDVAADGVPEDARLVAVRLTPDDSFDGGIVEFMFDHESFPDTLASFWDMPTIEPRLQEKG